MKIKRLIIAILVLASILRFVGLYPNINHSDEGYIVKTASDLVLNFVTKGDINPHSFKYGSFIYYYQAAIYLPVLTFSYLGTIVNTLVTSSFSSKVIGYASVFPDLTVKNGPLLNLLGRGGVALLGVASVYLVFLITRRLFNVKIGLFAALILAITPFHVRDSHYITTDIPSLFFILLSIYSFICLYFKPKLKWFILSGLFLGFSCTVRYFPIAVLVYPLVLLATIKKGNKWLRNTLIGFVFVFVGVFLGLPFLFLEKNGGAMFLADLQKYSLPWYGTSISAYIFSLVSYLSSFGKIALPSLSSLLPQYSHQFYLSYLFFNGFGILPSMFAVVGIVIVLIKSIKKFIFLMIIPLATYFYVVFYISSTYERSIIPVLPFLAIFLAVFLGSIKNRVLLVFLSLLILVQPFYLSSADSIACSDKMIQKKEEAWIDKNISENARVAYLVSVSFPSKNFNNLVALTQPSKKISMEELPAKDFDYVFINASRLDYETYSFFANYFIPPAYLYENSYYSLVFSEYASRAELAGVVEKPFLCDANRVYFFKLPKLPTQASKIGITKYSLGFEKASDLESLILETFGNSGSNLTQGDLSRTDSHSLMYAQNDAKLVSPRIKSEKIMVDGGKTYTFSVWARAKDVGKTEPSQVIARIDYSSQSSPNKLGLFFKKIRLIFKLGLTPSYFEKVSLLASSERMVALSPRVVLDDKWQRITITATAPLDVKEAVVSVQNVSTTRGVEYFDDFNFSQLDNE